MCIMYTYINVIDERPNTLKKKIYRQSAVSMSFFYCWTLKISKIGYAGH